MLLEEYKKNIDQILGKYLDQIKIKISLIPFSESDDAKSQHEIFSYDVAKLLNNTISSQDVKTDRSNINEMFQMLSPEDKKLQVII
jgi:hypothetical protein